MVKDSSSVGVMVISDGESVFLEIVALGMEIVGDDVEILILIFLEICFSSGVIYK